MLLTSLTFARFLQGIQRAGAAVASVLRSEATKENEVLRLIHLERSEIMFSTEGR